MIKYLAKNLACTAVLWLGLQPATAGWNMERQIDLHGPWLIEIGDNPEFARPQYDDSKWETITVPGSWENEGFPGYDGYAWYRKHFVFPEDMNTSHLYLKLGKIDDVDEVYLNGQRIGGMGEFPPQYKTAWDEKRRYKLDAELLRIGAENVIAVRVYDGGGGGGIIRSDVGIYTRLDILNIAYDLSGKWKFAADTTLACIQPDYDDSDWQDIIVPCVWEKAGYPELDGLACYRKTIQLPLSAVNEKLMLLLGKINDFDEVYFNGTLIGRTGKFPEGSGYTESSKDAERVYVIPPHLILPDADNVIAVRVFDLGKHGGIYEGYVCITTRNAFMQYDKRRKKQ
jgi:sialate O-acetylesterase